MKTTWEMIALATRNTKRGKISKRKLFYACLHYIKALKIYNKHGANQAYNYLTIIRQPIIKEVNLNTLELDVRRILVHLRLVGRLFNEKHNCLRNSITLTAGLLGYGYQCKLLIGKQKTRINKIYDFHAWVEVNGIPINENLHVRRLYSILISLP